MSVFLRSVISNSFDNSCEDFGGLSESDVEEKTACPGFTHAIYFSPILSSSVYRVLCKPVRLDHRFASN